MHTLLLAHPFRLLSYSLGVYDVTEFVAIHPGGRKLLLAAGRSIAPFWALYAEHKKQSTYALLEEMRIGNLPEEDVNHSQVRGQFWLLVGGELVVLVGGVANRRVRRSETAVC
jgi:cytochrome b involved in lipid metabolism